MPVNWKNPDAFTRLLAAMVAAQDMKLDYRKIASMYGNGATYDSIEGRFRLIKKEAAAMKAEIDTGLRSEAPARGANPTTPKNPKSHAGTPKKERVIGGRVGKGAGTPSKKRGNAKAIKEELDSCSNGGSFIETLSTEDDELAAAAVVGRDPGVGHEDDDDDDGLRDYYNNASFVDEGMDLEAF